MSTQLDQPLAPTAQLEQSKSSPAGSGAPDLKDLRGAADESATHTAKALALYQLVVAYVALALLQLSDADYVLGQGQSLPIVGSTVPTEHFLAVAPALLFVLHVALLLQWRTLKQKICNVVERSTKDFGTEGARIVELLHPFILTRSLLPPQPDRLLSWCARALAMLGLVAIPLAILVAVQVRSLAFHDASLTLLHRLLVLGDLAALWLLLPRPVEKHTWLWRVGSAVASIVLAYYVLFDAVIPAQSIQKLPEENNLTDSFWPRRLDLRGSTLQSKSVATMDSKPALPAVLNLKGRDLRFANMSSATLIRVDLTGTDLTGAELGEVRFVNSKFGVLEGPKAGAAGSGKKPTRFAFARAARADFRGQKLGGVDFTGMIATAANFAAATMDNVKLTGAGLDFADLRAVDLRASDLRLTSLLGADLRYALLSQADFTGADLRGVIFYRNPKFLARMHLTDMTYARSAGVDENGLAQLKEAFELSTEDRRASAQAFSDLQAQEQVPTSSPLYGLLPAQALWVRHDYLPFSAVSIPSVSRQSYVRLLHAFVEDEFKRAPHLAQAMAWRDATEALWLQVVYAKDKIPHASKPNEPSIRVMQRLMIEPKVIISALAQQKTDLLDGRFRPWDAAQKGEKRPSIPEWFPELKKGLTLSNEQLLSPLALKLHGVAQKGDELALTALAHLLAGTEKKDAVLSEQVAEMAISRKVEPEVSVAIATFFERGSPIAMRVLGAAANSPDVDWRMGQHMGDRVRMQKAAAADHVEAGGFMGSATYLEARVARHQMAAAWKQMVQAAFRGMPMAQMSLGHTMAKQGDFKQAIFWYDQVAEAGDPHSLNHLAWLLATTPEEPLRNGNKAVRLSQRVLREVDFKKVSPGQVEQHVVLDTLAAAYAATGAYELAVQTQRRAISILPKNTDAASRVEFAQRLRTYQSRKPWTDATIEVRQ